jgi:hypothetical protein
MEPVTLTAAAVATLIFSEALKEDFFSEFLNF